MNYADDHTTLIDGPLRIHVEHDHGVGDAQWAGAVIAEALDRSETPEEITAALEFRNELDGYAAEQVHAAERVCQEIHEALNGLPDKPLKADLVELLKSIRETFERSEWEY